NPGSALAVFNELVVPVLELLRGQMAENMPRGARVVEAVLETSISSATGRMELVPVSLRKENDTIIATPIFGKSNLIGTLARAQGNIRIPEGNEGIEAGAAVTVELPD
ncbi:MAG: molybdopterin molybdenumtransferase MoeA, partial [Actinobacteria bacterium]|nr:molybdopterin molybdenumtransferase MoeA [Actinomycetota bacterium]